ncbi:group II intron reverse transcriptase/maturase [Candidatus Contubernalis alkaliaceticus]|uniref:group II intron reverse transcriptase/maturase n=1 Tax=Candidatus Contubernalis alkaliaceticus TaxID=338645 RepID=UPI001F4BFF5C|nr:group II intron reverse transcriptase/maturase [Candidatus Contubernalis alkalaceticus]UNC92810.1 group II intron reverse transcriptase/maturase [Candidatus Contubernalis alkalaceticus]
MIKTKSFNISKQVVYEAYKRVKANRGAAGIDEESLADFENNLKDNLYKLWNRMSSGSYFPPPVKAVEIPKKNGGVRVLGIPTVSDRIAQMTVKIYFEPGVEPYFHPDSYGYRPGKSAIDAVRVTRERCWRYDWVLEFDIKGLFDSIDHELLMKAVRKHTDCKWVILYIERWLKAPFQTKDGKEVERESGTPQGGVISPVLANLFLHYTFDNWMQRNFQQTPWARYADDGIAHCRTKEEAEELLKKLEERFNECGLELHPDKTRIIYCKDDDRRGEFPIIKFDFLGYTFRPRRSKSKYGKHFINFTPAVSNKACKAMRNVIRNWRMHLKPDRELIDLSRMFNPVISGWVNYYGHFYRSELYKVLRHMNKALVHWARRKYKKLTRHRRRAEHYLGRIAKQEPQLFAHWKMGILPAAG